MPKILVRGYSNDEYCDVSIPCLCLDLDVETIQKWIRRIALVAKLHKDDGTVYSLDFWEYGGDFFDIYDLDDSVEGVEAATESIENEDLVVVEPGSPLDEELEAKLENLKFDGGVRIRTETDMLEVTDEAVIRCGMIKHTSTRLETVRIMADDLGKLAGGLKVTEA